jgi:hypothetical protein
MFSLKNSEICPGLIIVSYTEARSSRRIRIENVRERNRDFYIAAHFMNKVISGVPSLPVRHGVTQSSSSVCQVVIVKSLVEIYYLSNRTGTYENTFNKPSPIAL